MSFTIIIWILVFFGIFYFLAIRPQRRQKQQHSEMVSMLKKGDEVVTIGGMFGTVSAIGDDWVELEVAKRTRVRYLKRAISSITSIDEYDEDEEDEYIEAGDEDVTEEADEDVRRGRGRSRRGRRGRGRGHRRDARRSRRTGGSQGVTPPSSVLIKTQRVTTGPADAAGPVPCRDSCLRPELRSDVDPTQG